MCIGILFNCSTLKCLGYIAGHAKCKLFISHGGLFSTLEATYHGVPMLGMPVFGDQSSNLDRVVSEGWGDVIYWDQLTHDIFSNKIHELIENPQ